MLRVRLSHRSTPALAAVLVMAAVGTGCRPHGQEALQKGDQLLEAHKPAEAIPLLEVAATDLPGDARVWNFLGLAYHATGRRADALKAYLMALRQDRNLFEAQFNLGTLYFEEGNWIEAERSLRVFLGVETNRTRADAWNLLSQCEVQLRKPEDAERSLANALKLEPNRADFWSQLAVIQSSRRRLPAARQSLQTALRLDPTYAPARLNLAVVSQQLGDKAGALAAYRAYLESSPKAANAEEVRAVVRQLEGGAPRPVAVTNAPLIAVPQQVRITNAAPAPVRPQPTAQAPVVSNPPPRTVAAVLPAPVSAPASTPQSSRVAAAQPVVPNPPVTRPVTNPSPATTPVPAPAPAVTSATKPPAEVKPEIVPVDDSPKLQPARDGGAVVSKTVPPAETAPRATGPAAAASVAASPAPAVAPVQGSVAEARPPETTAVPAPAGGSKEAADKPGFWGKVNPVRWGNPVKWFKADPNASKPAKAPTPLSPVPAQAAVSKPVLKTNAPAVSVKPAAASNAAPAVVKSVPPASVAVAVPAPIPVVPRYSSRSPQTLVAGDRAAAQAQFNEGIAAYDGKDLAGAMTAYQRATELDPTHFPSQHNLGWAALDSGDLTRALLAAEIAVRLDPNSANATRLFAAALQRGNFPADAAAQLERLIAQEPGDAAAHFTLAGLYARNLGQTAKARVQYLKVLELSPKHPQEAAIRVWLANHPQI